MKESKGNDTNCIKIKMYQYNLLKTIIDTFLMIHYNINGFNNTESYNSYTF